MCLLEIVISREDYLRASSYATNLFFARVLAVAASEVVDYASVSVSVSGLVL